MAHADFVHLRVHSAYSLSEGALRVKDLVGLCQRHRMPAVGVTDTNNLFGALEFSLAARSAGVQPIIGVQIGLRRTDSANGAHQMQGGFLPPDEIVLLAQSEAGYENILALVSKAFLQSDTGEVPQIDIDDLAARNQDIIALTGGANGPVGRLIANGQGPAAEEMLSRLAHIFENRLYVELMRHGLEVENRIEGDLIDLAYRHNIPLVATNEAFFADEAMYEAHDALLCISEGVPISKRERRRATPEHRFKSAEEMRVLFADIPEAISNTLVIAQRCAFMPDTRAPILPKYPQLDGRSEEQALRELAEEGLEKRLADHVYVGETDPEKQAALAEPYRERFEFELGVINQMGYPGYFLIVADFIQWARRHDIPVGPGRGSGAGSVIAWALTITDLDPLRWGLLFERFLNPERVSMPDFDIDFCKDGRDKVIRYVQSEYGHDRVAQIITFGKLEARAVLRDVGRVLEMPYSQVDRISKLVPNNPANPVRLQEAIDGEPALQDMQRDDENVARLINIALKLEGLFRHASTHAAGVVIGDRPLDQLVPLYRDPRSEMPVTQFNMKYVEMAGLVKFDFLGLKTLTVLDRAVDLLKDREIDIDLAKIPLDDKKTFDMLCKGDAAGVFQLESSGMRDVLKKLRPDRFEDIIAVVALYRPGPMDNIPSYIRRKHGEESIDYLHPMLEGILNETYGIAIYQEQVMEIARVLSGYSLGGADLLRRAMGKKIRAEMEAQRKNFIEGAVANGVHEGTAADIFVQVEKFAGYGFNKSHAAAYALVAYQTAYLKANYPVEFLAACMTLDAGNTDKLGLFRVELERQGIELLPPDIQKSDVYFSVEENSEGESAVRYALAAIRNVGAAAMESLVSERGENGPFKDLFEFAERLDSQVMNKRQIENLARSGAFDTLVPNRQQVFAAVEMLVRHTHAMQNERESNQVNLFGDGFGDDTRPSLPDIDDWSTEERLHQEHDAIGFYLSAHPLESYRQTLNRLGVSDWVDVQAGRVRGGRVTMAGIVSARKFVNSARGGRLAFAQMSDATGSYELTVFSELLAKCRDLLESGTPLLVTADVQRREDEIRLTATAIQPLDEAAAEAVAGLKIFLRDIDALENLSGVMHEHGVRGRGRVSLVLDRDLREIEMDLPQGYQISAPMRSAIKSISGVIDVVDL
jgi:DNA polymerase-3 subunit alpha